VDRYHARISGPLLDERFRGRAGLHANAYMGSREVRKHCRQTPEVAGILRTAVERLGLSARGCHRVLKLSRTIADLAGGEKIKAAHVREAIQYRALDRRSTPPTGVAL
jgi:magnesium chelatase family protein